jgi:hypothetical protein
MHVQVFVPTALKPQAMLQSTVQGARLLASVVVQLGSVDEPPPPAPVEAVPAAPEPAAPEDSPPAPVPVPVPVLPLAPLVVAEEVPVDVVAEEVPLDPAPPTGWFPLPVSVLLEQPEGAQR